MLPQSRSHDTDVTTPGNNAKKHANKPAGNNEILSSCDSDGLALCYAILTTVLEAVFNDTLETRIKRKQLPCDKKIKLHEIETDTPTPTPPPPLTAVDLHSSNARSLMIHQTSNLPKIQPHTHTTPSNTHPNAHEQSTKNQSHQPNHFEL